MMHWTWAWGECFFMLLLPEMNVYNFHLTTNANLSMCGLKIEYLWMMKIEILYDYKQTLETVMIQFK